MARHAGFGVALLLLVFCTPLQALWPKPEAVTVPESPKALCLSRHLQWESVGYDSDILLAGFDRYDAILRSAPLGVGDEDDVIRASHGLEGDQQDEEQQDGKHAADGQLSVSRRRKRKRCHKMHKIEVSVTSSDQSLTMETRESYSLSIDGSSHAILIQANSVFGALRAMETLSQLVRRRSVQQVEGSSSELEGFVPDDALWPGDLSTAGADDPALQRRHSTVLLVDELDTYDAPRFRYRGLLIDTARHFLPVSVIKEHLDAMAMVKLNCLHWHLTDDESFPWQLADLPGLADKGAFAPEAVYTVGDIREVVEYARFRGIRVIPELDTPGHTQSWGKGFPALLTECYNEDGEPTGQLGPLNPARNETFGFVWRLLRAAAATFPDPYLHLGGDEVSHECWKSNPEVQEFMKAKGFGSDYSKLEGYFMSQVVHLAAAAGKASIVWQEAFDQGVPLPPMTRVQVWKWWKEGKQEAGQQGAVDSSSSRSGSDSNGASITLGEAASLEEGGSVASRRRALLQHPPQEGAACSLSTGCGSAVAGEDDAWKAELKAVTGKGYDAILSSPWYLNLGTYGGQDWKRYYSVDPTDFSGTPEQKDHVLGGTACAWGEFIDAVNAINRVWPRAAAVAERLWSPAGVTDLEDASQRLADLRCRMLSRGIAAQSMGPGFCPGELTTRM